jgi:hypothetical protein
VDFEVRVKLAIYGITARRGLPPRPDELASELGASADEIRAACEGLARRRLLVLDADGRGIRMAPPFSGIPTPHRVRVDGIDYFANCAWDALGIPAALHRPGQVRSSCARSHQPLRLEIGLRGPARSPWLFHCLVPAAQWWNDIVFT